MRPAWLDIDLDAIDHNTAAVKRLIGPDVKIIAVVKSNAYGHGTVPVARRVLASGASMLAVALVQEAVELRESGIRAPILVLGTTDPDEAPLYIEHDVCASVGNAEFAAAMSEAAGKIGRPGLCHIKIDSGMGRQGVRADQVGTFGEAMRDLPNLDVQGVFSHFASSPTDTEFTCYQIGRFTEALPVLQAALGREIPLRHLANSGGIAKHQEAWFDAVRPGALLYGIFEKNGDDFTHTLRQAMSLKAKVVFVKDVCAGESVGYARTHICEDNTRTAIIPLGYADGYPRALSNNADVLIHGKRCPIIGRVSMDSTVVDVGGVESVQVGDEVVLLGRQGDEIITTGEMAHRSGTIVQEIVARMGTRLPRLFTGDSGCAEGE